MAKNSPIKFFQDNKQVIYSIVLLVAIPGIIIVNAIYFSQSIKRVLNQSLQERAVLIGEAINAGLIEKLDSPEQIQTFVDYWKMNNVDTRSLDIFYRENDEYKLIASFDKEKVGISAGSPALYAIAWANKWPAAQKISKDNTNYWLVVMPLKNLQGESKALLSTTVSAEMIDAVLSDALTWSYFILIVSILFIVLLLFANSRLFEYSILYNKIKEVDVMKDEFISMASHELRTPVTVIRGYAAMMLEDSERLEVKNQEAKEYLGIINISTERLSTLIDDLLDVSRIEQGRLKMSIETMGVGQIIEDTVKELKIQADTKGLVLAYAAEPDTNLTIKADKDRLKQVLINLIGNSIKYTPTGSIEVKAKNKDNNLVITIKDTGIGMTAKEREHLFEKFYRVKNKKTTEISGTGLGLWITKQIVELMSGTISVDSIENVGTQITLEFPLAEEAKK
ncbi:MAG: HAMP domain-containing sensor histidine kinase [Candidatus Paceibacterota bacterium]